MTLPPRLSLFGIRHHGPGSARSLRQALEALQPDLVLVEGPPEANELISWVAHSDLIPPVALLIYAVSSPQLAVFYPFAVFSPEWQALDYCLSHKIPVGFMDLPQSIQLAERKMLEKSLIEGDSVLEDIPLASPSSDPLALVAQAAGYTDGERWWERQVEHRREASDIFLALSELMTVLRTRPASPAFESVPVSDDLESPQLLFVNPLDARREAYMRQTIRQALADNYQRVAVVCGAWHTPALTSLQDPNDQNDPESDALLLQNLPELEVSASWVPWSYGRLAWSSGYGAGIESPGWYEHLWQSGLNNFSPTDTAVNWAVRMAHLLRTEDLDISSAHAIETVRLAESLSALRGCPLPGLAELTEAARAVFCSGDDLPLQLIHEKLILAEKLGQVPQDAPAAPLQADLAKQQKQLRLPPEAAQRDLQLDLRKPNDLARSHLLHRLTLLDIEWGYRVQVSGKSGSFHEQWKLQWKPELAVKVVEASLWGNTVAAAASGCVRQRAGQTQSISELTGLVGSVLLADLPEVVEEVMQRLESEAALASDLGQLIDAVPPLVQILRYGDVRKTGLDMVERVASSLVARIWVGLPAACHSLDDDAAKDMYTRLIELHQALTLLQNEAYLQTWLDLLQRLVEQPGLHGLLAGRACRLLFERSVFSPSETARHMNLFLSLAASPAEAADWVEGFLSGSGELLLHDQVLWELIDEWVIGLSGEHFIHLLPLLRRTFASFSFPERRALGEKVASDAHKAVSRTASYLDFDPQRAEAVLPVLEKLLGLDFGDNL